MEDQEIMEQFLENRQSYVIDNMNAVAGCGGIGVGEGVGSTGEILGVKYDEQLHEGQGMGDDDELKYAKEVQQSEKQQSLKCSGDGRNSNELAEKEVATEKYEVGDVVEDNNFENVMHDFGNGNTNGHSDHDTVEVASANLVSLVTGEISSPSGAICAEVFREQNELGDDEDPSSLATNTTGKSSSLSDNLMQPVVATPEEIPAAETVEAQTTDINFMPSVAIAVEDQKVESNEHSLQTDDLDHMQSQLNPDAKEFVPSFESNLTSPIRISEEAQMESEFFGSTPAAFPRHIIPEDDFVAQSPRKGRGDNMDIISLPAEQEFEKEADQRPHELEQNDQSVVGESDAVHEQENELQIDRNVEAYARFSETNGPETSVDIDADVVVRKQLHMEASEPENDLMKQSMYVTSDEAIENVLNSVQPIPTEIDSVNNSFTEETYAAAPVGEKELLQIEEKEHVSNSPSTEEMQINLQCTDQEQEICQIPFDISEASAMHESIYIDHVQQPQEAKSLSLETESSAPLVEDCPIILSSSLGAGNLETTNSEASNVFETTGQLDESSVTHSSSADEKHLIEETKEIQEQPQEFNIEHSMSEENVETTISGKESPLLFDISSQLNEPKETHSMPVDEKNLVDEIKEIQETHSMTVEEKNVVNETKEIQEQMLDTSIECTTSELNLENTSPEKETPHPIDMFTNLLSEADVTTHSPLVDEKHLMEETKELQDQQLESNIEHKMSESNMTNSSLTDEKHLIEDTKEVQINPLDSDIEHRMSQMAITTSEESHMMEENYEEKIDLTESSDIEHRLSEMAITAGIPQQQIIAEEVESAAAAKDVDEYENSYNNTVDKCEQIMVIDQSPTANEMTDITQNLPQQEVKAVADILENEIQPTAAIHAEEVSLLVTEDTETTSKHKVLEDISQVENVSASIGDVPSQLIQNIEASDNLENISASDPCEPTKQKDITGTEESDTNKEPVKESAIVEGKENDFESAKLSGENINEIIDSVVTMKCLGNVSTSDAVESISPSMSNNTDDVKKSEVVTASNASKAKVANSSLSSTKKPTTTEVAKKIAGAASKPKLPPAKPAASSSCSDRKPVKATATSALAARKPLGVATATPKTAKSAATNSTTRSTNVTTTKTTTTRPIAAARTITSASTSRKPAGSAATTGSAAKPRPASASSAAPAKPSTVAGSAASSTVKQKAGSPRGTLTSQLRKTAPPSSNVKSPIKTTTANTMTKPASSSVANRTKTVSSAANGAASTSTKQFTARAAPKFTTSTTPTTRRLTVGGTPSSPTTAQTAAKTTSTITRKSSPTKTVSGKTPTKPTTATTALKSKSVNKSSTTKTTANNLSEQPKINGSINADKSNNFNGNIEGAQETSIIEHQQQPLLLNEDRINAESPASNSEERNGGSSDQIQIDLTGA